MPKLVHSLDGAVIKDYPLGSEGEIRFGRRGDNDIQLDDISVSGNHASIEIKPSPYMDGAFDCFLQDLGSTNGTIVNGKTINQPHLLKHLDVVQIGTHELRFVDEQSMEFETTRILIRDDKQH